MAKRRLKKPANNDFFVPEQKKANQVKKLSCLTEIQKQHRQCSMTDNIVVAIGPAGTGKTYVGAAVASELMFHGHIKNIVTTRPTVEVGKSMGALPGELDDKYAPYLEPFVQPLQEYMGAEKYKCDKDQGRIRAKPLQYMRGDTYDDAIMLLDEAQNTTVKEMKMFLTRAGINTRIFISGDVNQCDLNTTDNGLAWLIRQIKTGRYPLEVIEYKKIDCVRSGLCAMVLDMIDNEV